MKSNFPEIEFSVQQRIAARLVDVHILSFVTEVLHAGEVLDDGEGLNDVFALLVEEDEGVKHVMHLELIGRFVLPLVNRLPLEAYNEWVASTAKMVCVDEIDLLCVHSDWTKIYEQRSLPH